MIIDSGPDIERNTFWKSITLSFFFWIEMLAVGAYWAEDRYLQRFIVYDELCHFCTSFMYSIYPFLLKSFQTRCQCITLACCGVISCFLTVASLAGAWIETLENRGGSKESVEKNEAGLAGPD